MKLQCVYDWPGFLTKGKVYETSGKDHCGQYPIICDNGELICIQEKHFWDCKNDRLAEVK
jgi:hypothetical protein